MNYQIIFEFSAEQTEQLLSLYRQQWWSHSRTLKQAQECVQHSQLCVGVLNDKLELVGFARVLSDKVFKALIFDVIVEQSHQGRGISTLLLDSIKRHPSLCQVQHFELYCLPEMFDFYRKQGFSEQVSGVQLMRLDRASSDSR